MIILFIASGLFLGWTLGANDAANIFGSAVGSRMLSFTRAAVIASVFVILGAVVQGAGASDTLGRLGSVNAIGGAFTVALAAGVTVYFMTKAGLPVSTTQAIVGAIVGWNFFTDNAINTKSLVQIVTTWITGPVLGAVFAYALYHLVRITRKRIKIHLLLYESYIRTGLMIAGAFGAFSLGANNIANVMGVFVPSVSLGDANFGLFTLTGAQQLFFLGGIAIAAGILTYSKKVMQTVGANLLELTSEAAFVVVLSQALVLFIFSSSSLSGLMVRMGLPAITSRACVKHSGCGGSSNRHRPLQGCKKYQHESVGEYRIRLDNDTGGSWTAFIHASLLCEEPVRDRCGSFGATFRRSCRGDKCVTDNKIQYHFLACNNSCLPRLPSACREEKNR